MENRFLLNRANSGRFLLLLMLGIGFGVAAAVLGWAMPAGRLAAVLLAVTGAVVLVAAIVIYWREKRDETALQAGADSFTLYRPDADPLTIADPQVAAIAIKNVEEYSNGRYTGLRRTVRLWIEPEGIDGEPIEFRSFCPAEQVDHLWPILDRLVMRLAEKASAEIAAGGTAAGALWAMNAQQLTVIDPKRGEVVIPIEDLFAADAVGQILRIWRRDEDEVAAEIPRDSRSAYVLEQLLVRVMEEKPPLTESPGGSLGQVLYERRGVGMLSFWAFFFAVFFLGIPAICIFVAAIKGRAELSVVAVPLGLIGAAALLAWRRAARRFARFCFWGAHSRGLFSENRLRYSDVDEIAYYEETLYHHGFYHGTTVRITLRAADKTKGKISHSAFFSKQTATDLEKLRNVRDLVSERIVDRMLQQLDEGGKPVNWCGKITIYQNGIEVIPPTWFRKTEPKFLDFEEIEGFDIKNGFFYLYVFGKKKPIVQLFTGEYNFYPGLKLFSLLLAEAQVKADSHLSH